MSTIFDRFAKLVKEEFGLDVIKTTSHQTSTFESLFGVSVESMTQYELPYSIDVECFEYNSDTPTSINNFKLDLSARSFDADKYLNLAA